MEKNKQKNTAIMPWPIAHGGKRSFTYTPRCKKGVKVKESWRRRAGRWLRLRGDEDGRRRRTCVKRINDNIKLFVRNLLTSVYQKKNCYMYQYPYVVARTTTRPLGEWGLGASGPRGFLLLFVPRLLVYVYYVSAPFFLSFFPSFIHSHACRFRSPPLLPRS